MIIRIHPSPVYHATGRECQFAQVEIDLWKLTPEDEYFDHVNPLIFLTNGWLHDISLKYK